MAGLFITFEGGEGTGKSTQAKLLAERLRGSGRTVVSTREPGGTAEAEAIRTLLVTGDTARWSARAEALLNYAARDSHLIGVIRPALARGDIVICDRFMDSTRAYQAYAGDCPLALIDRLEADVLGATRPVLTLIFDMPSEAGLVRARERGAGEDRYERKGADFHRRLRDGFLAIAKADSKRCRIIDASGAINGVTAAVWRAVEPVLANG